MDAAQILKDARAIQPWMVGIRRLLHQTPELGYQEFVPGDATLTDDDKKKLDTIVKALDARPGLSVELSGSVDPVADRTGLQNASVEKEIRTRQWQSLSTADKSSTTPDQIVLSPDNHAQWLKKLLPASAGASLRPARSGKWQLAQLV